MGEGVNEMSKQDPLYTLDMGMASDATGDAMHPVIYLYPHEDPHRIQVEAKLWEGTGLYHQDEKVFALLLVSQERLEIAKFACRNILRIIHFYAENGVFVEPKNFTAIVNFGSRQGYEVNDFADFVLLTIMLFTQHPDACKANVHEAVGKATLLWETRICDPCASFEKLGTASF